MKVILDLDYIVSEMGLCSEKFGKWKTANLDNASAGGSAARSALEENGFMGQDFRESGDRRTG